MGFFKNLMLRSMATAGWVTGGAHQNDAIVINREQGNPMATGLTLLGLSKTCEFKKADISQITVMETSAHYQNGSTNYVGCRYKIAFTNGETSIVFVVANKTGEFETLLDA